LANLAGSQQVTGVITVTAVAVSGASTSTLEVPSWAATVVVAIERIVKINRFFIFIYSFGFSIETFDGNPIVVCLLRVAKPLSYFSIWETCTI
jgi:hypothetical protein